MTKEIRKYIHYDTKRNDDIPSHNFHLKKLNKTENNSHYVITIRKVKIITVKIR